LNHPGFEGSYNEKNQYDELQLIILVLEARTLKKKTKIIIILVSRAITMKHKR
jgi:hypothetical protein